MTAAGAPPPAMLLQLDDGAATAITDPLGLWRSCPAIPASAAGPVWRVCLPADAAAADKLLTRAERSLAEMKTALMTMEPRLRALVTRDSLTAISGPRAQIVAEATAFVALLEWATADPSRVETEQGGRMVAVTELDGPGMKTAWPTWAGTEQCIAHGRAVGLAFASRLALMRTFLAAIEASALLATLLPPEGVPFAFPVALRFVAQVLAASRHDDRMVARG